MESDSLESAEKLGDLLPGQRLFSKGIVYCGPSYLEEVFSLRSLQTPLSQRKVNYCFMHAGESCVASSFSFRTENLVEIYLIGMTFEGHPHIPVT